MDLTSLYKFFWVFSILYSGAYLLKFISLILKTVPEKIQLNFWERLFLYINISYFITYIIS